MHTTGAKKALLTAKVICFHIAFFGLPLMPAFWLPNKIRQFASASDTSVSTSVSEEFLIFFRWTFVLVIKVRGETNRLSNSGLYQAQISI